MQADPLPSGSPSRVPWRTLTIPPACGALVAVLVLFVWRATEWPYRREFSLALYFLVTILVNGLLNGKLKSHPFGVLSFAAFFTVIGAALAHSF
jgi:hypothetical protein